MVGWHHQCNGHELGQTAGDGEGQGSLVCCSPWGPFKALERTEQLNNNQVRKYFKKSICYQWEENGVGMAGKPYGRGPI